jgi:hypothetical protein
MLYLEANNTFTRWSGEPINDARHPLAIEQAWSDEELAAIGLYKPADADPVPEGKVIASTSVERVNGVVKYVNALEDAPPPPVPEDISDRQFAQILANMSLITQDDALAWVKIGTVPAQLQAIVDAIPDSGDRFAANMLLGGATVFQRHHPLVSVLAAQFNKTDEQMDDIWRDGSLL